MDKKAWLIMLLEWLALPSFELGLNYVNVKETPIKQFIACSDCARADKKI